MLGCPSSIVTSFSNAIAQTFERLMRSRSCSRRAYNASGMVIFKRAIRDIPSINAQNVHILYVLYVQINKSQEHSESMKNNQEVVLYCESFSAVLARSRKKRRACRQSVRNSAGIIGHELYQLRASGHSRALDQIALSIATLLETRGADIESTTCSQVLFYEVGHWLEALFVNAFSHVFHCQAHTFAAQKYHRVLAGSDCCVCYNHGDGCTVGVVN